MVTFSSEEKTCSCCGKTSTQQEILSCTTFGQPDLDLRPPPMKRETIFAWVQNCSHCGYCSDDISDTSGTVRKEMVNSVHYQAQLSSSDYPQLANQFLCFSIILEEEKKLVEAAWQALHAAWACDDAMNEAGAVRSRLRAVKLIEDARSVGLEFSEQADLDRCIQADALRRTGEFQRAKELLQSSQNEKIDDMIKIIWKFQLHLVETSDSKSYTITDAQKYHDTNREHMPTIDS